jgi:hypothetical protein
MKKPPIIKTSEVVKAKLQLLEALADNQVTLKMLPTVKDEGLHPVDRRYKQVLPYWSPDIWSPDIWSPDIWPPDIWPPDISSPKI